MRFSHSSTGSVPADKRRLLRGMLLAVPVSAALWAVIGATAVHELPAHSRHALSWRLHAVAAHVVGHYRHSVGMYREALA
jgi:hypothetical protein